MTWFSRRYAFTARTSAKAEEVEGEFDNFASALNGLFDTGVVEATGDLASLTTRYQDVPGASLSITPRIPSILKVTAMFYFAITANPAGSWAALGTLNVDGVDQTREAQLGHPFGSGTHFSVDGTVCAVYAIPLSAASHTVKLVAKKENLGGSEPASCYAESTGFLYELVPDPSP